MTLDEAIAKAKVDGDVQLAEWLRQARGADASARWYTEKLRDAHRTIRNLLNENTKLRELMARMAEALGIDCEWADPNWCKSPCVLEFGCWPNDEHAEIQCPAWAAMRDLGVEVDG